MPDMDWFLAMHIEKNHFFKKALLDEQTLL